MELLPGEVLNVHTVVSSNKQTRFGKSLRTVILSIRFMVLVMQIHKETGTIVQDLTLTAKV
ncbi:hypothetical protein C482_00055 [Natrialba chahannaoensis JCM 10990]|uniref:Uncharacterized protein n=1 Tax=Natrialba chahannaoensis JCM 10990 TaxID=1227492 RepID=M0B6M7_9EURY|nr:hypothetical protein C482_00055 [Natrialba chahannaoensis JCM 10990]